jgi:hypothetical protein
MSYDLTYYLRLSYRIESWQAALDAARQDGNPIAILKCAREYPDLNQLGFNLVSDAIHHLITNG